AGGSAAAPPKPALPKGSRPTDAGAPAAQAAPAAPTPPYPNAAPGAETVPGAAARPAAGENWEPVEPDTAAEKTAKSPPPKAAAPDELPKVELQTFRLDKTRDELFEEVFKHKAPPLPPSVEVTLLVDGKSYGTLWILYNYEQKRYTFPVDPVLNALQGLVRQDLWDKLAQRAMAQSRFTVDDLIACGFPTVLNTTVFELSTGVPAQLLGTKIHPLTGEKVDPYSVPASKPAPFSAFLNARAKERLPYYQYNPIPSDSQGHGKEQVESGNRNSREPFITDLDAAANLRNWVLEAKATVLENKRNGVDVHRQDVRLVHDWPKRSLRLNVGDLIFPTTGFQSFYKIGGMGLSRDFSLQPHLPAYPVKDFEFFLTSPSEVKVYINGTLRGVYQLEQGTHDLQGFPFTAGESEVEIHITDNIGQTQTLKFSFIHEPTLLAKGISAFSFNVGYRSRDVYSLKTLPSGTNRETLLNYEYDLGSPAVFLDYRRGITNTLTLETYSQAMDTAGMLGLRLLRAIPIGKIKTDLAGSYHHENGIDWAGNLEYTYLPRITSNISPVSWRFKTEYLSGNFYRPGQDTSLLGALDFAGSFQKYTKMINVNLGASYDVRRAKPDFYSVFAGLSRNWPKGVSSSLTFKNTFDRVRTTNTSVSASVNYFFNYDVHSVSASERVENHRPDGSEQGPPPNWDYSTDLLWDYNGSAPFPHNPTLNMATSFGPISNDYSAKALWNGNQGMADVMIRRYEPKASFMISNYVDLTLQSALVYADGNFALSRPIENSFVMVKGIENERDCDILVNSNQMGYDAKGSSWRPGVVPNISPYYLKNIHLEVQDPPLGSNDERTDYTIYPGYKSGYVFYMGSKSNVIVLGTLMLDANTPVEYQSFQAIPLDGEPRDPVLGFTNKVGKFQLTRLEPGKYAIELYLDGNTHSTVMTLSEDASGIKSVGTLFLSPK
ncbi:MAG TPA: hypothetical protein VJ385_21115, partial [Fibrobacteria bacterium]|nr:hypothetical protein [Fibrobacteria bacterium]